MSFRLLSHTVVTIAAIIAAILFLASFAYADGTHVVVNLSDLTPPGNTPVGGATIEYSCNGGEFAAFGITDGSGQTNTDIPCIDGDTISFRAVVPEYGTSDSLGSFSLGNPNIYNLWIYRACNDPEADNYDAFANLDDGSCSYPPPDVPGCTDPSANNYDPSANIDDSSCTYDVLGCMDPAALNYDASATVDDSSCMYDPGPQPPTFADEPGEITDITENSVIVHYVVSDSGSAPLSHFELHYASEAYYLENASYDENEPIVYDGGFALSGATDISGLACGTTYHFVQSFTNQDNESATSSDATFTTSDCTGGEGGGGESFAGGDGSPDAPWIIDECTQIPSINDHLSDSFILASSLDCTGLGSSIMIGGSFSDAFSGDFDGDGHSLLINIDASDEPVVGLFRSIFGGSVHDLSIGESLVSGADVVGSLAGIAADATITRVSSSAIVSASVPDPTNYPFTGTGGLVGGMYGGGMYGSSFDGVVGSSFIVGGLVGFGSGSYGEGPPAVISRSKNEGTVYGQLGAGGLVGYMESGMQIRNSYSDGTVTYYEYLPSLGAGSGAIGGLVGLMTDGLVSRSYAAGMARNTDDTSVYPTGGLIGMIQHPEDTTIVHSFAAASVDTIDGVAGGFVGYAGDSDDPFLGFYNNYFDTEASGLTTCSFDEVSTRSKCRGVDGSAVGYWLQTVGTPLSTWNNTDVWDFSGGAGNYPALRAYAGPEPEESDEFVGGEEDSEEMHEIISSAGEHGAISPAGTISVTDGDDQSFTLTPDDGYVVDELLIDDVSVATSTTYTFEGVEEDHAIHATFALSGSPVVHHHTAHAKPKLKSLFPSTHQITDLHSALAKLLAVYKEATGKDFSLPVSGTVRNLEVGSMGDDVRTLQTFLIAQGFSIPAGATGYFGPQTKAALGAYQAKLGINPAAGYFGPITRTAMKAALPSGVWW